MKTIRATMPATIKNSMAVKLSANISNDDKVVKDFVRHPLFKDFFIRKVGGYMKFIFFGEIFPDQIIDVPSWEKALEYIEEKYYRDDIVSVNEGTLDDEFAVKITAWADISGDDDEDCVSYERRPMYLCTEASYRKLSSATIKMLTGE